MDFQTALAHQLVLIAGVVLVGIPLIAFVVIGIVRFLKKH